MYNWKKPFRDVLEGFQIVMQYLGPKTFFNLMSWEHGEECEDESEGKPTNMVKNVKDGKRRTMGTMGVAFIILGSRLIINILYM